VGGGTLYVVATPLGHLGDLTARAADTLRAVPVVAAEDTRRTRPLLSHLGAHPRLLSYHAHSGPGAGAAILRALAAGDDVALVTDAGTPAISDPGSALVAEVREAGFRVVPLPGPSAVVGALSASGLPADRFLFLGFLPRKGSERARLLARIGKEEWTMVLYEAPGRISELLADLAESCGPGRRVVLVRELTKLHEEFRSGTVGELALAIASEAEVRGECTVIVAGAPEVEAVGEDPRVRPAARQLLAAGLPGRDVARLLTDLFDLGRNEAYRLVVELSDG
jgi:16S rRNA (cytidine1402-2'-O)-methyltransferase